MREPALAAAIDAYPDFPTPGILFRDITPLLAAEHYGNVLDALVARAADLDVTHVVGAESRGFLFGPALAAALGASFVPARKPGRLPGRTTSASYDLEYGCATLEVQQDALAGAARPSVLVHDDLLATGGTSGAMAELARSLGAALAGFSFIVELPPLGGRDRLAAAYNRPIGAVVAFDG